MWQRRRLWQQLSMQFPRWASIVQHFAWNWTKAILFDYRIDLFLSDWVVLGYLAFVPEPFVATFGLFWALSVHRLTLLVGWYVIFSQFFFYFYLAYLCTLTTGTISSGFKKYQDYYFNLKNHITLHPTYILNNFSRF